MQGLFSKAKVGKKGIFYSITVLLFMLFLLVYFNTASDIQKKEDEFHIERVRLIVMDHFVRDFDNYYIQEILATAAKPAMIELTSALPFARFSKEAVVDLMTDGETGSIMINPLLATNDNFHQALGTLTFDPESLEFSYVLESVEQPYYDTLQLNFLVNYSFSSFSTRWSKSNKPVNISFTVYSLMHPDYDEVIGTNWVERNEGCYIWGILSISPPPDCEGKNIMPPCGNGVIDEGEECDGDEFGVYDCSYFGYISGDLQCIECQIDSSGCSNTPLP
ncbi:hypothetical protein JXB28_06585 [Candidatus Woesearchaeota archaeon]|nr:hypothetical protein [Candidatus Woesearchaeota archaeon]